MIFQILVSIIGIAIFFRISSLVEKYFVILRLKSKNVLAFMSLPLLFNLFFKELLLWNIIYIGIFLLILILLDKISEKIRRISFGKLHLDILQRIFLTMSSGFSLTTAIQRVWSEMGAFERQVFCEISELVDKKSVQTAQLSVEQRFFYRELGEIQRTDSHALEQVQELRRILTIQRNLRHRSRLCLVQIRGQAVICLVLYGFLIVLSVQFLGLKIISGPTLVASVVHVVGIILIFRAEKSFRWKT